jgi:polyisoprenoid-binding protein YceI
MSVKLIIIITLVIAAIVPTGNWKIDADNAKISFSVKGPFGTVNGNFTGLKSDIQFDEKDLPGSSFTASIDAASVSTGIGLRNRDLRKKEEWFNVEKYPLITFHSKKIEKAAGNYQAIGELTLKGITRQVDIPFSFTTTGTTALFKGQFAINREDYHLGKTGGSVGDMVTLTLDIPVKK